MKKEIINILGSNHTNTVELLSTKKNDIYGLYTYEGNVYVLLDGDDIDFDDLTLLEQTEIKNQIVSYKWKLNKTLQ